MGTVRTKLKILPVEKWERIHEKYFIYSQANSHKIIGVDFRAFYWNTNFFSKFVKT